MVCVCAEFPERRQKMRRWIGSILSETLEGMKTPLVVRESAPRRTPWSKVTAMMEV
jgi:hypothetical protein